MPTMTEPGPVALAELDGELPRDLLTDITWTEQGAEVRGQFWADGPEPGSLWVMPFDHPGPVLLRQDGKAYTLAGPVPGWRQAVKCAERARAHGSAYAVPAGDDGALIVHCDPDCADAAAAAGRSRQPWEVVRVVDVLTGRAQAAEGEQLCGRCAGPALAVVSSPEPEQAPEQAPEPEQAQAPQARNRIAEARARGEARWDAAKRAAGIMSDRGDDVGVMGSAAGAMAHAGGRVLADSARIGVRVGMGQAVRNGQRPGGAVAVRGGSVPAAYVKRPTAASSNPADGITALSLLSRFFSHYDYWGDPAYADLMAAWVLQTHAVEDDGSPIWRALCRLIIAAMHGCGKSNTLDQLAMACGTEVLIKLTFAGIRDHIGKDRQAAILDDAQITFGAGKKSEDVRHVINAHTKGRAARDASGPTSVYGQVAMAGLPKLLTGKVSHEIEDTLSRCFVLWKERKPKGWHVPEVSDAAEKQVREKMVPAMREWCLSYRDALRARAAEFGEGAPTGLPDLGGGGRGNDQLARPPLTVCDVATGLLPQEAKDAGDPEDWDWSARIRRALIFVSGAPEPVEDEESPLDGVGAAFDALWASESTAADLADAEDYADVAD